MASINTKVRNSSPVTAEGGLAKSATATQTLARLVNACLLWEDNFYIDGKTVANVIADLVKEVTPDSAQIIAIRARNEQKLRHIPLLIVREMARAYEGHRLRVADTLEAVIQRPDELTEFLAIYWKDGKQPLSAQVKKGLARAFTKFNEYSLAKYNRDGAIKLRDVAFLSHVKPNSREQELTIARLVNKDHFPKETSSGFKVAKKFGKFSNLETPDTWEVALSGGADKAETFIRLINDQKLGALALLRNLRNMIQAGVDEDFIREAILNVNTERVMPFRFITAARYAPQFESELEQSMFKCLDGHEKLDGTTALLVDVSGSMDAPVSSKSELTRLDAACGLAMLLREVAENVKVYTFSNNVVRVPPRRGFALAEGVKNSQAHSGTYLGQAVLHVAALCPTADRVIVISDEQAADRVTNPFKRTGSKAYMINVATNQYGVSYGDGWNHIDGWSEACVDYILAEENEDE
jgi:TROVE domain/von Willebrand factor type A domain